MPTMRAPNPYARREWRGRLMDNATIAACMKMESVLGYQLTIVQGVGGAPASAGTHLGLNGEGGRAVDLAYWDAENKNRVGRDVCFAGWPRPELPGVWGAHWHGVNIFINRGNRRGIAESAFNQIGSYDRGRNGLKGDGDDVFNYRPEPKAVLSMDEYKFIITGGLEAPLPTKITKMRDSMVETLHDLSTAIALGKTIDGQGNVIDDAVVDLKASRRVIHKRLTELPKR